MILVDTSVLFASISENDMLHKEALEVLTGHEGEQLYVNQHVITELASVIYKKKSREEAIRIVTAIPQSFEIKDTPEKEFLEAVSLWNATPGISLVDATLLTASKHGWIVCTFDKQVAKLARKAIPSNG